MDIGITFITAIPVGAEQERDLIKISQRYMRMHGLFDVSAHGPSLWIALLALVPIHVAVLSGMPPIAVKLSSFTRLLRVEALAAWFTEKEKDVHFAVQKIAIFKFILAIFGVSHWIGCLWWWVASWSDFDESTWISQYLHTYPPEELSQYHMINGTAVCVDDFPSKLVLSSWHSTASRHGTCSSPAPSARMHRPNTVSELLISVASDIR